MAAGNVGYCPGVKVAKENQSGWYDHARQKTRDKASKVLKTWNNGFRWYLPSETTDSQELRYSMEKLHWNDAFASLGNRKLPWLWVLDSVVVPRNAHMEIIQERLERELNELWSQPCLQCSSTALMTPMIRIKTDQCPFGYGLDRDSEVKATIEEPLM